MRARRLIIVVVVALFSLACEASASSATNKTPVSVRVQLNVTTIRAGHSIHGTAIITNSSSESILVQGWSCSQWLYVGLANKVIAYDPAIPASACYDSVTLKPGQNRVPITVSTRYDVCEDGPQKGTPELPHCPKVSTGVGMPALPKGTYHVVVLTIGQSQFAPYASRIRVTLS